MSEVNSDEKGTLNDKIWYHSARKEKNAIMIDTNLPHVFLSYSEKNQDCVESLALRLRHEAYLSFWFSPWHSIPGIPLQEQMEEALQKASSCTVFISSDQIEGWQNEQMRTAIQRRVEDDNSFRIIPVLLPSSRPIQQKKLPFFLRRYEPITFQALNDEQAFKRLLSGILGIPPIQIEDYIKKRREQLELISHPLEKFHQGHALIIGIANYPHLKPLPEIVLNDARDLSRLLSESTVCGYPESQVITLFDQHATNDGIRSSLTALSESTSYNDTVIIFFSGHGAHALVENTIRQFILPYDCDPTDLPGTAISGDEITCFLRNIKAERILVLFDSCHSGGVGEPKGELSFQFKNGLSESYYQQLAQGQGRVVIASCRPAEVSWVLPGMNNSLFTYYLLEALRGQAKTLGDGYIRVFDIFRHVAEWVPGKAKQHPIFKAADLETDFAIAMTRPQI